MSWLLYLPLIVIVAALENFLRPSVNATFICGQYLFLVACIFAEDKSPLSRTCAFFCAGLLADIFFTSYLGPATLGFTFCAVISGFMPEIPRGSVVLRMLLFMLAMYFFLVMAALLTCQGGVAVFNAEMLISVLAIGMLYPFCRLLYRWLWPPKKK